MFLPFALFAVGLSIFGLVGTWGWLAERIRVARFRLRNGEWPEPVPALTAEGLRELASAERGRMILEELRSALDGIDAQQNDAQEHRSRSNSPGLGRRRV
jgi:hypothetical protein